MRYILFICCFLFACSKNIKEPEFKFDKNEFAGLMSQVYLLDAHFNGLPGPIKDSLMSIKFKDLLDSKGLLMSDFIKIQQYYKYNYKEQEALEKQIIQIVKDSAAHN